MRFGPIPVADAEGAILAHATTAAGRRLKKAHRLGAEDIAALQEAGVVDVIAARLEPGDVAEDEAAAAVASALIAENVERKDAATGRVNLHAAAAGVFTVDRALIDAVNAVDPSITIATLADLTAVEPGRMVATVKIIPFAAPGAAIEAVLGLCGTREAFSVHAFRPHRIGLIQTVLPGVKQSVLDKTARITGDRLARSSSRIVREMRVGHSGVEVADAVRALSAETDMILAFGASAICDEKDVIPAAIGLAGGTVERVGMPVDPGNLLVLGAVSGKPVLGAPGCARSPRENGFDWVLDRLIAGLPVTARDIAGMGVGGLLMEIATRPQPRETGKPPARLDVHAIVLAAGRSRRMGGPNKLLAGFSGTPLVRLVAAHAAASRASGVTVVTGHQAPRIHAALDGLTVGFADNPDYASGLASSLKAGIRCVPETAAGAMVVLGDMPGVTVADLDRLVAAFEAAGGGAVVRATHEGKRGNPVILPRALFGEVARLEGDTGARHVVETSGVETLDVEIGRAASVDVDTPRAMALAGGVLQD